MLKKSKKNPPIEKKTIWQRINFFKRMVVLFSNQRLKFFMITCSFFTLAIDIFYEFGHVYLTAKWTLGPAQLIFYNAVLCLGLAVGNGWLPSFFASKKSNRFSILCAMGGFALLLIGIVLTNTVP